MSKISKDDMLFVLQDTHFQGGEFLSIFTDMDEAKWYCQLYLRRVCMEKDKLKWKETHKGIFESKNKYQRYKITAILRGEFKKHFDDYYI